MAMNENSTGFSIIEDGKAKGGFGLHPLHEAALRIAEIGRASSKPRAKTKDLIGALLCHGARAWRYSQPKTSIHLYTTSPSGRTPVSMRIG